MEKEFQEELNMTAWQLTHISRALSRAKRLEKFRTAFHQELYDCIAYPTMNIDPLNPKALSTATDAQAIRIIEAKERYDKLIQQEYARNVRWQNFLLLASEKDQIIMIRYFKKKKSVSPAIISSLLSRLNKRLEEEELKIEEERSAISSEKWQEQRNSLGRPKKRRKTQVQFYENGRWLLMDQDKYELKLQQEQFEQNRKQFLQRLTTYQESYSK